MPDVLVRRIPKDVYKRLKEIARRNHRSLNAEIVATLNDEDGWTRRRLQMAAVLPEIDRIRENIAKSRGILSDSTELIREDRDSR